MGKKGVLLVNLGTPDSPKRRDVYKYLKEFLLDGRVIDINPVLRNILVRGIIAPFRSKESSEAYKELWTENGSPIKDFGFKLRDGVQQILGDSYKVVLAMRYQSPSIKEGIKELLNQEIVDEIIVLPLFPQYASATTGSVYEEVMDCVKGEFTLPNIKFINSYPTNEKMIDVFVKNAKNMSIEQYKHFLFSFHGLPERQLRKSDNSKAHCLKVDDCCNVNCESNKFCYSAQCHQTAHAIAKKLNLSKDQYTVCFQSRLGKDPWVQPYTSEVLDQKLEEGYDSILVFSPAFVADCLETTIEIGEEYKEEFIEAGGKTLDLVPSLNDDPQWYEAVAELVR